MKKIKKEKGFTLVEILVATALTGIAFASILFIIFYSQKAIKHSSEEAKIATEGRQSFLKISQLIRKSKQIDSISTDGRRVDFTVLLDASQNTSKRAIYYNSSDNTLNYDPDTTNSGDEMVIANNVAEIDSSTPMFQSIRGGEALEMNYKIVSTNNVDDLNKSFIVSGIVKLRNLP